MYLYHYPDIWFDYATWHAKSGSIDSAIKVYQRSLKALPGNSVKLLLLKVELYICIVFQTIYTN